MHNLNSAPRTRRGRQWWFEIFCVLCMSLSLFAIVLTLGLHQGRPLPQWPLSITINALLSACTAIFKGSMLLVIAEVLSQMKWCWYKDVKPLYDLELFQQASRGPKGALQLIWAFRKQLKPAVLPVNGAILTVIAIFVDPFAQQILTYQSCPTHSFNETRAQIARINTYTSPHPIMMDAPGDLALDADTQGAIYAGLFGTPRSTDVTPFSCESGHCEFKDYYSLAVCTRCEDISDQIVIQDKHEGLGKPSLPSGVHLDWTGLQPTLFNMSSAFVPSSFKKAMSIDVDIITGLPPSGVSNISLPSWSLKNPSLGAAHCALYPCVQQYHASVNAGVFNETRVKSIPIKVQTKKNWEYTPLAPARPSALRSCLKRDELSFLKGIGCETRSENPLIYLSCLPEHWRDFIKHKINYDCLFLFPIQDWWAIHSFNTASRFFEGNISTYFGRTAAYQADFQLQAFYNNGRTSYNRVSDKFEAIANSVTSHMRHVNNDPDARPVFGATIEATTCVEVRWAWLMLPLVMFLFTSILLLWVLNKSNKNGTEAWKSSTLALLFNGLDSQINQNYQTISSNKEMDKAARFLRVKLQETDEGWRFSEPCETSKLTSSLTSPSISGAASQTEIDLGEVRGSSLSEYRIDSHIESGRIDDSGFQIHFPSST